MSADCLDCRSGDCPTCRYIAVLAAEAVARRIEEDRARQALERKRQVNREAQARFRRKSKPTCAACGRKQAASGS